MKRLSAAWLGHGGLCSGAEQVDRRRVARFLDGDDLTRFDEGSGDEVEAVQGARRDHDIGCGAHDTAGASDPVGQHLAQPGITGRVADVRWGRLQCGRRATAPGA
jgi:hypothetical protein